MTTDPGYDVRVAGRLAASLMLRDISFAALEASTVKPTVEGAESLTFDVPKADARWIRVGDELRVMIPYQVDIYQQFQDGTKNQIVVVRVLIRVDYEISEGVNPSDDEMAHFVGVSAFMHSWPYLRAEVEALTTKLRIPPLVLPVMLSGHAHQVIGVRKLADAELQALSADFSG